MTPTGPLYETWTPPDGMPATGQQGTQVIPATESGFDARPAGIYLPPHSWTFSGGIRLEWVAEIAATGVDRISVGGLTHSAPALDIALDYEAA